MDHQATTWLLALPLMLVSISSVGADNTAANQAAVTPPPKGAHGQTHPHAQLNPQQLIKVALQHEQEGRPQEAIKTLDEALGRFPESAQLLAVRASFYLRDKRISDALVDLEKAVSLAPKDASLRVNRAQAYRAFAREQAAMDDLNQAVELAPDLVAARFNRGSLHFARGEFAQALADFEHCIVVEPHTAAPYYNRASTYRSLGRDAEAISDLQHFIELTKNDAWKKSAQQLLQQWQTETGTSDAPSSDGKKPDV